MTTITTRSGKGAPLTNDEVDANFTNLNDDKAELSGAAFTGAITTTSTIDGRDVASDGAKLDGIEASADVTDTANVTAAGALMDSELTDITAVKSLDQGVATTDSPTFAGLTTTADVSFGDNDKAIFGAGSDLQIYHDSASNHSIIAESGSGSLFIRGQAITMQNADGSKAYFGGNGDVATAYYGTSAKLATTSTGIDVTGTVTADGLTVAIADYIILDGGSLGEVIRTPVAGTLTLESRGSVDIYGDSNNNGTSTSDVFRVLRDSTYAGGTAKVSLKVDDSGDVSFYDSAGSSQSFFWDASAESLGIGTSSPSQTLDVSGNISMSGAGTGSRYLVLGNETDTYAGSLVMQAGGGSAAYGGSIIAYGHSHASKAGDIVAGISSGSGGAFRVNTSGIDGGSDVFVVEASGRVGIGTNSPVGPLSLQGGAGTNGKEQGILLKYSNGTEYGALGLNNSSGWPQLMARAGAGITFHTNSDLLTTNEAMRLDASGNLLVGKSASDVGATAGFEWYDAANVLTLTRSGGHALSVNRLSSDGDLATFRKDGTTVGSIGVASEYLYIHGTRSTDAGLMLGSQTVAPASSSGANRNNEIDLGFSGNAFRDLYLSGNINLSASSQINSSTAFYLDSDIIHFRRNNEAESARIDSSGNLLVGTTSVLAGTGNTNFGMSFVQGGSSQLYISSNATDNIACQSQVASGTANQIAFIYNASVVGRITSTSTATAYNTSSDQRLKDNIADAPSASDDIDAIQVRSFDWKADGSHQKYGMVAQELQSVAPEAVSTPEDPEEMMGVDYSKLVPMLIKEIQSLRARVAQLEGAN